MRYSRPLCPLRFLRAYLLISLLIFIGGSSGEGEPAEGLYHLKGGHIVIQWSPGMEFSLDPPSYSGDQTGAGWAKESYNSSFGHDGADISEGSGMAAKSKEILSTRFGLLEADISASGVGGSHLGWTSVNPRPDGRGRHQEYGRKTTDLVGVFSIDMTIRLGSGAGPSPGSADWIPCL